MADRYDVDVFTYQVTLGCYFLQLRHCAHFQIDIHSICGQTDITVNAQWHSVLFPQMYIYKVLLFNHDIVTCFSNKFNLQILSLFNKI